MFQYVIDASAGEEVKRMLGLTESFEEQRKVVVIIQSLDFFLWFKKKKKKQNRW